MDCKIHSDCLTDRGYCHPKTKMCLCKNGRSTYPVCNINKGSARDCEPNCSEEEYCDLNDKKCMCNLGGFPPNCNVKKCEPFEVELDGECTCMYGRNSDDECSKCRDVCGRNGACTKTGNILFVEEKHFLEMKTHLKNTDGNSFEARFSKVLKVLRLLKSFPRI